MDIQDAAALVYTPAQLHAMGRVPATADAHAEAAGRQHFADGGRLEDDYSPAFVRGWFDAHRVAYAQGVVAAMRAAASPNVDHEEPNPYAQLSPAWEAWGDGFEATLARPAPDEPMTLPAHLRALVACFEVGEQHDDDRAALERAAMQLEAVAPLVKAASALVALDDDLNRRERSYYDDGVADRVSDLIGVDLRNALAAVKGEG